MMWIRITALVSALFYILWPPKRIFPERAARYVVALFLIWGTFMLWPGIFSARFLERTGAAIVVFAAGILALDYVVQLFAFVRRSLAARFQMRPLLPGYVSEICRAMDELAARRIGALIILARKQSLDGFIEGGISFDAQIRSEVLLALFQTSSPVHDGAMIVNDGRIQKVKAILPLATSKALPMGIGTRHRSAIGITEKTDAIAFVVSEERGHMSLAYRGILVKAERQKELARYAACALKGKDLKPRSEESPTAVGADMGA